VELRAESALLEGVNNDFLVLPIVRAYPLHSAIFGSPGGLIAKGEC
jgi:hypothetical protein